MIWGLPGLASNRGTFGAIDDGDHLTADLTAHIRCFGAGKTFCCRHDTNQQSKGSKDNNDDDRAWGQLAVAQEGHAYLSRNFVSDPAMSRMTRYVGPEHGRPMETDSFPSHASVVKGVTESEKNIAFTVYLLSTTHRPQSISRRIYNVGRFLLRLARIDTIGKRAASSRLGSTFLDEYKTIDIYDFYTRVLANIQPHQTQFKATRAAVDAWVIIAKLRWRMQKDVVRLLADYILDMREYWVDFSKDDGMSLQGNGEGDGKRLRTE